jgi:hypothetical protein
MCFGSHRIHHQGMLTCTLTEITCNASQIFIMCVVGVWRHYSEPVVCVCVCVCARARVTTGWKLEVFSRSERTHTLRVQNYAAKHRPRT